MSSNPFTPLLVEAEKNKVAFQTMLEASEQIQAVDPQRPLPSILALQTAVGNEAKIIETLKQLSQRLAIRQNTIEGLNRFKADHPAPK